MLIIKFIRKLIKALSSAATPVQLASGFCIGMWLGITPYWTMLDILLIMAVILININIGMAILGYLIFSAIAYILDPVLHAIGYQLLVESTTLTGFWQTLVNAPILSWFKINNTINLGGIIVGLILTVPTYYFAIWFVSIYRTKIEPVVSRFKIVRMIKGSKVFSLYQKVNLGRD